MYFTLCIFSAGLRTEEPFAMLSLQGSGVRACIFTAGVLELEPSPCAFEFAVCSAWDYADLEAKRSWTANTYSACMLSRS